MQRTMVTIPLLFMSLLCMGVTTIMSAQSKETTEPVLALKAELSSENVTIGTEFKPVVSIINVSGKTVKLNHLKPTIMVPEIWDATTNKRVLNAPTVVYNQICANQETVLAPQEELYLYAIPILVTNQSVPSEKSGHLRSFWTTQPGKFTLKYSVPAKSFLPEAAGEIHAREIRVNVIAPEKKP